MSRAAPHVLYVNETSSANPLLPPLAAALHPDTVRFTVCTLDAGGPLVEAMRRATVPCHHTSTPGPLRLPLSSLRLAALVRELRPDLVHVNLFLPGVAASVARRLGGLPPSVVFTRHHDLSHHLSGKPWHRALDRWTAMTADHVIAPSTAVAQTLIRREGVPAEHVTVVPHGLDWSIVLAGAESPGRFAELPSGPLALAVGRHDPLKDYPTLITAVARARREVPELQLAVAGAAGAGAAERLRSLARERGMERALHVIGHTDHIHSLMVRADVLVQASRAESFGLSVLEAMGLGLPLAVTTPGGVLEVVQPWYPALAPGDADALAGRLLHVLSDLPVARRHAASAAEDVTARFTAERMAAGHAALYDRVLSGQRHTRH